MKKTIITILALMLFIGFLKPICYAASITYENGDNSEAEGSSEAESSITVNISPSELDGETAIIKINYSKDGNVWECESKFTGIVLNLPIKDLENKDTALVQISKSKYGIWDYSRIYETTPNNIILTIPQDFLSNDGTQYIQITNEGSEWKYNKADFDDSLILDKGELKEEKQNYISITKDKEDDSWKIKYLNKDINMTILIIGFVALALVAVVSILINALLIRRYRG